ncbi:MAG: hypothetical protein IJ759_04010 [Bacteroidales bacterium]|nr:hypothetical protein [Bacteroidales bacterium]
MIVSIFKKNYFLQLILLILLPLLLWIPAFIRPAEVVTLSRLDMPLYDVLEYVFAIKSVINTIVAFLLVVGQAFLINYIFTYYELTKKNSYFPAFIYMLMFSSDYRIMTLSSILFANCIIILAIWSFLQCYNKNEGLDQIFLTAFLVSLSSLFYVPYLLFMIWIWVGLFNFKIYKWRPLIVSLLGMLTPYLVLMVIYYLSNQTETIVNFFPQHFALLPQISFLNQPIQIVYMGYLLVLILPALFYTLAYKNDQKLSVRKRTSTIIILFAFSLLPFLYTMTSPAMSLIFAPALAFMFTVFFFSIKRQLYSNLFILILVILTIAKIYINY